MQAAAMGAKQGRPGRLTLAQKSVYALGDFTTNTVLGTLTLIYASYFLIEIAGLRPALAGLVPLIGRTVDAVTDPAMGRISDLTRSRWGRRRPYLLLGAAPFGLSFAALWVAWPLASQSALFVYYTSVYCLLSVAMTVITVPYLALQPEMASDYDERTSLNAFRSAGGTIGIIAAVGMRPLAEACGGGSSGFAAAGMAMAFVVSLPWLAVYRITFERPDFALRPTSMGLRQALAKCSRHATFSRLVVLYLTGRVAIDLMGVMLVIYFTYWIGRSADFETMMLLFFSAVVLSIPLWLRLARHMEKSTIFVLGSLWWMLGLLFMLAVQPGWPAWSILAFAPVIAAGFAVVDLIPWSMLGDVVDEADLSTGERHEGLYHGVFSFLRKLGGALAVSVALILLDSLGFSRGADQSAAVLWAIRLLSSVVPAVFLAVGAAIALGYPLTRKAHAKILSELEARSGSPGR